MALPKKKKKKKNSVVSYQINQSHGKSLWVSSLSHAITKDFDQQDRYITEYFGHSTSIFVGRIGYPGVRVGPMSVLEGAESNVELAFKSKPSFAAIARRYSIVASFVS